MASASGSNEGILELQKVRAKIEELEAKAKAIEDQAATAGQDERKELLLQQQLLQQQLLQQQLLQQQLLQQQLLQQQLLQQQLLQQQLVTLQQKEVRLDVQQGAAAVGGQAGVVADAEMRAELKQVRDDMRDMKAENRRLQHLGTWTSSTVQKVGRDVLSNSKIDTLFERLLTTQLPPISPAVLGIINAGFQQLQTCKSGAKVQEAWTKLFTKLYQEVSQEQQPCFHMHDTSNKGFLHAPIAKIGFTFTANGQVQWPSVVWFAEAKGTLEATDKYEEALGQVSDRAHTLFKQQRQQRMHVIAAVLGCSSMEVLFIPRSSEDMQAVRTTRVPLEQSGDSPSPAAQLLLRLFFSPAELFGYHAPVTPPPMHFTSISGQRLQLDGFACLRASMADVYGTAFSGVYQAQLNDGSATVVKFGAKEAIDKEADILQRLNKLGVSHVPELLGAEQQQGLSSFIVTKPVGKHLCAADPPEVVIRVVLDVAYTIDRLQRVSILHRDVSPNNILCAPDGSGLLVDFGSASSTGSEQRAIGTVLFSAFSVLWGECNTASSDLEALFHSLVHIAVDGEVPGCREPSVPRMTAYRIAATLHPQQFQQHVLLRCASPELRELLRDLHGLFFRQSAEGHTYVKTVSLASFTKVCQLHLDRCSQGRQRGSATSAGPPPAGATDPVRGMRTAALPVSGGCLGRTGVHGTAKAMVRRGAPVMHRVLRPRVRAPPLATRPVGRLQLRFR